MTEQPAPAQQFEHLLAAAEFQRAGISVVPAQAGKRPLENWKQYQSERADLTQIVNWFGTGHTGVGIVTGAISGNLEMVEAEGRAVNAGLVKEAEDIARNTGLEDLFNRITDGYFEVTPSGGYHWLYKCTEPITGNQKLAQRPGAEAIGREVLFETRGEGGFVVVSPTSGDIHPDKGSWDRLGGKPDTIAVITPEEREAFLSIFKTLDQMPKHEPQEIRERYHNTDGTLSTGDDYNQRETWDNILTPQGWKKAHRKTNNEQMWIRPGKDQGISASTGANDGDNLYVFSTSTIFDPETPYSKFAAYTLINFGDLTTTSFQQARKQLMTQGYGQQIEHTPLNQFTPEIDTQLIVDEETGEILESSWQPADIEAYLSGTIIKPIPGILCRQDGPGLLYKGRVHSFYGESESGKSWVAQYTVAEVIQSGKDAIYIDFEADVTDIIQRLQLLGTSNHDIATHFTYIKPETRPKETDPFWQQLLERKDPEIVIIDGVTESLTIWGAETKDNDSITSWMRQFPKRIATRTGAAVVTIDHVNKSADTRGRFAIGGQAKLASLDGAAYLIEPIEGLAPGKTGTLSIRVTKDRPGGIRANAGPWRKSDRTQEAAQFKLNAEDEKIQVWINKPSNQEEVIEQKIKTFQDILKIIVTKNPCVQAKQIMKIWKEDYPNDKKQGISDKTLKAQTEIAEHQGWLKVDRTSKPYKYILTEMEMEYVV
jgi:hypothetical protein